MSSSVLRKLGRPLVAVVGALAVFAAFGASNAVAAGSITPPAENTLAKGASAAIKGTLAEEADFYAVAVCAVGSNGTKCDHTSGAFIPLTEASEFEEGTFGSIKPNGSFANWNFQADEPGIGMTNCEEAGKCVLLLSEYKAAPFAPLFPPASPVGVTIH